MTLLPPEHYMSDEDILSELEKNYRLHEANLRQYISARDAHLARDMPKSAAACEVYIDAFRKVVAMEWRAIEVFSTVVQEGALDGEGYATDPIFIQKPTVEDPEDSEQPTLLDGFEDF
jgi:hypothetical protein